MSEAEPPRKKRKQQTADEAYQAQMPRPELLECERMLHGGYSPDDLCGLGIHFRAIGAERSSCGNPARERVTPKVFVHINS